MLKPRPQFCAVLIYPAIYHDQFAELDAHISLNLGHWAAGRMRGFEIIGLNLQWVGLAGDS